MNVENLLETGMFVVLQTFCHTFLIFLNLLSMFPQESDGPVDINILPAFIGKGTFSSHISA